jgi:hypothetical protein
MRTILIIILVLYCAVLVKAQTITNFSIDNGGAIVSGTNIKIHYTIGEVNIQELNAGGIVVSEGFINSNLVSVTLAVSDEDLLDTQILIYPNPATEFINIRSTLNIHKLELYTILGKKVLTTMETKPINIGHISSGIYLLRVFSENGVLSKKVLIK